MSIYDDISPSLQQLQEMLYAKNETEDGCTVLKYRCIRQQIYNGLLLCLQQEGYELMLKRTIEYVQFAALMKTFRLSLLYTPAQNTLTVCCDTHSFPCFIKSEAEERGDCIPCFYAFENDHSFIDCGMCLLLQCEDYSFFVVDSGHYYQTNDNDRIHQFMRHRTPKEKKIVINGWLITHAHSDHVCKLMDFLRYNCDDVIIEGIYHNIVPPAYDRDGAWDAEETRIAEKLLHTLQSCAFPVYRLHTGMRFFIRSMCFDVLYTYEDVLPDKIEDYNDSSCVVMLQTQATKIFIPGDASVAASKILEERYHDFLKCDILQVSHHGHTGLSTELYRRTAADVAIFPVTRIKFDEEYDRQEANRTAISLSSDFRITSDGTVCIPLPYKKGRVHALPDETFEDFDNIYRLWKYEYTESRKRELYELFLKNRGKP